MKAHPVSILKKQIFRGGYICDLRQGQKDHTCVVCKKLIPHDEYYYSIIKGGGGLSWLKQPDRVHAACLDRYSFDDEPSGKVVIRCRHCPGGRVMKDAFGALACVNCGRPHTLDGDIVRPLTGAVPEEKGCR